LKFIKYIFINLKTYIKMARCNPANIPCCISVLFFILSIISGVLFLVHAGTDNHYGEVAIYTLAVTLLMWIVNVNIPREDKVSSTKVKPVLV
jgi:hypothetical protein